MAITRQEARESILGELESAIDQLAISVAGFGDAFELLSVGAADRLEAELFRPVQKAYATAKRTHTGFAARVGLPADAETKPEPGAPSQGVKGFVLGAVAASGRADQILAELQDTMLPVESGDAELRAGLSEVRELLATVPNAAREFARGLGR